MNPPYRHHSLPLPIDQQPGFEYPRRVELALRRAHRLREQLGALAVVLGAMQPPDGMMVRDGAAVFDHGIGAATANKRSVNGARSRPDGRCKCR